MNAWWRGLADRERTLLLVAAVVIGVCVWWLLLLRPLGAARDALAERLPVAQRQALEAETAAMSIKAQPALGQMPRVGRSLLAMADATARDAGLGKALDRVEPQGEREVRVWLKDAHFDALATWAEQLNREGIIVSEWSVDRALAPGVVNARLALKESP